MYTRQLPQPTKQHQTSLRQNHHHCQEKTSSHIQSYSNSQAQSGPQSTERHSGTDHTSTTTTLHLIHHHQLPTAADAIPTAAATVPHVRSLPLTLQWHNKQDQSVQFARQFLANCCQCNVSSGGRMSPAI